LKVFYKATPEPVIPTKGDEIDRASKENRDGKRLSDLPAPEQKILNTNNITSSGSSMPTTEREDDRSAYDKKVKQK
jgi:hypothetical protein